MNVRLWILCLSAFLLSSHPSVAQNDRLARQDHELAMAHARIATFFRKDPDSLEKYADSFATRLLDLIRHDDTTLDYPFPELSENCGVITSADGNFRIYSWDTWTGGTMHFFRQIVQWRLKAGGRVYNRAEENEEGDPGFFCTRIYTVTIGQWPYYLAMGNGVYSTREHAQSVRVIRASAGSLDGSIRLFRTKKEAFNSISVDYDMTLVEGTEYPSELIKYDQKRKAVLIAVVSDKGRITTQNLVYQLQPDGYFHYTGAEPDAARASSKK